MGKCVIVGIGNPYRSDDAVGWFIIDGLKKSSELVNSVTLVKSRGDVAGLVDIFAHYNNVFLIDACQIDAPAGAWQRVDARKQSVLERNPVTSTHGFGVSQAISLAKILQQLPETLILYLINGQSFAMDDKISSSVLANINEVLHSLVSEKEIQSCMNTAS